MNKRFFSLTLFLGLFIFLSTGMANFGKDIINKIKPGGNDIPTGFIYGKIPNFAKNVLKDNPWVMDKSSIKKLTERIYPGGDYRKISNIHVTIMANEDTPHGDDIVCYIILFRDNVSAKGEVRKLTDFADHNSDRVIVLKKENMAVYLHVDDVDNFHLIQKISGNIEKRLAGISDK